MSDTTSTVMESSTPVTDPSGSSEMGNTLHSYLGTNASSFNYPSTAASLASSDADYQHDLTNSFLTLPLSRPLSRASTTSCMSITLFKDGVEGKKIHRSGIPTYPYNLISTMNDNRHMKSPMKNSSDTLSTDRDIEGINGLKVDSIDMPSGPPVSLNEKMALLKTGQVQPHHRVNPDGPSVGPVVFTREDHEAGISDSDDASMTDYVRFQKDAARDFNE